MKFLNSTQTNKFFFKKYRGKITKILPITKTFQNPISILVLRTKYAVILSLATNLTRFYFVFNNKSISLQTAVIWSSPYSSDCSSIFIHWKNCNIWLYCCRAYVVFITGLPERKHTGSWCAIRLRNLLTCSNWLKTYVWLYWTDGLLAGFDGKIRNNVWPPARNCGLAKR